MAPWKRKGLVGGGVDAVSFCIGSRSGQELSANQGTSGLATQGCSGGKELPVPQSIQVRTIPASPSLRARRLTPRALLRSMASAFEGVVRSVVRELDRGRELTPVDSLGASASYQPYCLVGRKRPVSRFWRPRYTCVNLSIRDILEPDAPEPGTPLGTEAEPWPAGATGPAGGLRLQLWSRSSCRTRGPLPLPRRRGRAAAGQRGAGGPGTGDVSRRGDGVWQLQRLHDCVRAARGPQHLGGPAPREVSPGARGVAR